MSVGFPLDWDDLYLSQRCKRRAEVQHERKALMDIQCAGPKAPPKKFSAVFVGRRLVIRRVQRRPL